MIDWNTYRHQVVAGVGGFAKLSSETVRGYAAMGGAGQKTSQLDAKTRELIAIAVAVTLRCDGWITVHTDAAWDTVRDWPSIHPITHSIFSTYRSLGSRPAATRLDFIVITSSMRRSHSM